MYRWIQSHQLVKTPSIRCLPDTSPFQVTHATNSSDTRKLHLNPPIVNKENPHLRVDGNAQKPIASVSIVIRDNQSLRGQTHLNSPITEACVLLLMVISESPEFRGGYLVYRLTKQ